MQKCAMPNLNVEIYLLIAKVKLIYWLREIGKSTFSGVAESVKKKKMRLKFNEGRFLGNF